MNDILYVIEELPNTQGFTIKLNRMKDWIKALPIEKISDNVHWIYVASSTEACPVFKE